MIKKIVSWLCKYVKIAKLRKLTKNLNIELYINILLKDINQILKN